jgi:hypothetical protein
VKSFDSGVAPIAGDAPLATAAPPASIKNCRRCTLDEN